MARAKQAAGRKPRSKTAPVLRAAGLSLSLASGAAAAATPPAADYTAPGAGVHQEITLAEEEIFDVRLATFHVFDKENTGTIPRRARFAAGGGCGCGCTCGGCAAETGGGYQAPAVGSGIYSSYSAPVRAPRHARRHTR